ncbi:MAG TPA: hypothetical protein VEY33_09055 [Gemmatimonadota bacterium]|nr:hypothetical protein [Gemmatimonadota bacterium]
MNFLDLSAGSHTVRLDGAAENCEIGGENPRNATVLAGEAVQVAFTITCATVTGTIVVKTITTGGLDPDGYTISIDGGASQPITDTEPKTFAGLATGRHDLLLGGLDAGCTLNQPNPHSLILIGSGMSTVNFHVACPIT